MIKLLIGGSPCTYWSIAQTKHRETEASGIGWELFKNYLIAKEKWKPDYFLYENNVSAAEPIKMTIRKEFGVTDAQQFDIFVPDNGVRYTEINSALVSAQNRERFYVTNFGDIEQPKDRGILLRDILETDEDLTQCDKSFALLSRYPGAIQDNMIEKRQKNMVAKQVGAMPRPNGELSTSQSFRIYSEDAKGVTLKAEGGGAGAKTGLYAISSEYFKGAKDSSLVGITEDGEGKSQVVNTLDNENYIVPITDELFPVKEATKEGITYISPFGCVDLSNENSKTRRGRKMKEKSSCITTQSQFYQYLGTTKHPIYEVRDGYITIKGKKYPIKLKDGYYIIRKLTVKECMRLQTVPEWYDFPVSDSQAYKMLGNGWTIEVIKHLLSHIPGIFDEEVEVLSMYDGMACGMIALREMGIKVVKYTAYEIDKYAIKTATHNFPEIIEMGDAFAVREEGWKV